MKIEDRKVLEFFYFVFFFSFGENFFLYFTNFPSNFWIHSKFLISKFISFILLTIKFEDQSILNFSTLFWALFSTKYFFFPFHTLSQWFPDPLGIFNLQIHWIVNFVDHKIQRSIKIWTFWPFLGFFFQEFFFLFTFYKFELEKLKLPNLNCAFAEEYIGWKSLGKSPYIFHCSLEYLVDLCETFFRLLVVLSELVKKSEAPGRDSRGEKVKLKRCWGGWDFWRARKLWMLRKENFTCSARLTARQDFSWRRR